jgi:Xaa-Pro aminopeptidase
MGGYVRWFTDMPATNGYPNTVVFPRDDEMTVVCQGPFDGNEPTAQADSITQRAGDTSFDLKGRLSQWRGVKQILTTPSYASAHYTKEYDPELAATALKPFAKGTIGYVGTYQMSYATLDTIKRAFPQARFIDATDMVDRIKVIKSPEEMELVKRAALMQDGAMRAAFAAVKPGMRDIEVAAVAQHYSQCHGSEMGIYLCASMPLGKPSKFANRHLQNRVIQKGDQIALLVEDNGAGGMFTELGRSCVVGTKVPQAMKDELEFCKASRKMTLDLLKPGASCKDIWDAFNDFMRKNGRPIEARLYCHGQGYDMVERPLVRDDEPMPIAKDMNIVVHPTYIHGGYLNWLCDNYLIGGNGPGDRLHQFPEEVIEVG